MPLTKAKLAFEVAKKVQNFVQVCAKPFSVLCYPTQRPLFRITLANRSHPDPRDGGSGQVILNSRTSCLSVCFTFRRVLGSPNSEPPPINIRRLPSHNRIDD